MFSVGERTDEFGVENIVHSAAKQRLQSGLPDGKNTDRLGTRGQQQAARFDEAGMDTRTADQGEDLE